MHYVFAYIITYKNIVRGELHAWNNAAHVGATNAGAIVIFNDAVSSDLFFLMLSSGSWWCSMAISSLLGRWEIRLGQETLRSTVAAIAPHAIKRALLSLHFDISQLFRYYHYGIIPDASPANCGMRFHCPTMRDDRDQSRLLHVAWLMTVRRLAPNAQHLLMLVLVSWCMTFFELAAKISDVSRSRVAYVSCSLDKIFSQMSGPLLITRHGVSGQKEGVREPGVRGDACTGCWSIRWRARKKIRGHKTFVQ